MKSVPTSDALIEKMKEESSLTAIAFRLQFNAFLDYGFTEAEAFELLKISYIRESRVHVTNGNLTTPAHNPIM